MSARIGLVGCGGIAATHLQAYRDAGLDVVALCDRTRAKAEKLKAEYFPAADVEHSAAELIARGDVEVVDLTPHPEDRLPLLQVAIAAGKHVLSQKPFVEDLAAGRRLCDLADAKGVLLAVNQNGRFAPHLACLREAARAGLLGEIEAVRIAIQWDHNWVAGLPFDDIPDLVLYDFAIHWFDFVASVFPGRRADSVFACATVSPGQRARPPLLAQVVARFGAAQASLSFDADCKFDPLDETAIIGTKGTARSRGPSLSDQRVTVHTAEGWFAPELEGSWFPGGFAGAMLELLAAIESGEPPRHAARENLRSLELCFAARESAVKGAPVAP
ncbi:MAG TPA: Gfo/Idh/MocA family oxidoreductase [Planctomycetia bacterium]|nr:Gfo/Idh/MocA family oxidoreductase [Planctomycetia bacterium]